MDFNTETLPELPPQRKKPKFHQILYVQVVFAIVVGILIGHFYPQFGESLKPLGDAFIKLVKMIIAPVESTDQCNTCVKTSYFDHFLVGNYGTHETVVYQAR